MAFCFFFILFSFLRFFCNSRILILFRFWEFYFNLKKSLNKEDCLDHREESLWPGDFWFYRFQNWSTISMRIKLCITMAQLRWLHPCQNDEKWLKVIISEERFDRFLLIDTIFMNSGRNQIYFSWTQGSKWFVNPHQNWWFRSNVVRNFHNNYTVMRKSDTFCVQPNSQKCVTFRHVTFWTDFSENFR